MTNRKIKKPATVSIGIRLERGFLIGGYVVSFSVESVHDTGEPAIWTTWLPKPPARITEAMAAEFDRCRAQAIAELTAELAQRILNPVPSPMRAGTKPAISRPVIGAAST